MTFVKRRGSTYRQHDRPSNNYRSTGNRNHERQNNALIKKECPRERGRMLHKQTIAEVTTKRLLSLSSTTFKFLPTYDTAVMYHRL